VKLFDLLTFIKHPQPVGSSRSGSHDQVLAIRWVIVTQLHKLLFVEAVNVDEFALFLVAFLQLTWLIGFELPI